MSQRRVVVTGLGCISPLGLSVEQSWQSLLAGQSGVTALAPSPGDDFPVRFAATVKGFEPERYLDRKSQRKMDTFIQYGIAAADEALTDSELELDSLDLDRFGCAVGSGIGGLPMIEDNKMLLESRGPRKISPFFIPATIVNMVAGQISIRHGLRGPNTSVVTACATGTHNIGEAGRMIRYGDADVMLAGGAEACISPLTLSSFASARALSTRNDDPAAASRPFDRDRDGFVLGEGAGVVVLEEYEHARRRGATIYAELTGFGMSADGFHMTQPPEDGNGAARCMAAALADAGQNPDAVAYINAHGTSTPAGDLAETRAIHRVFGDAAAGVAVSSTKSMTGHLLGAAGGVEAVFSVLAIERGELPPTINLEQPGEGCDLDYVANEARQQSVDCSLSNSFGFGGTNASLVFKRLS
ncbi:MAG: beta-ketoacyl-ACP synthase II [Pseudomonadota bacterium]